MENKGHSLLVLTWGFVVVVRFTVGDLSFSIPEEMGRGSKIGNIAKDLGVNVGTLSLRKARLDVGEDYERYLDLDLKTGNIVVRDRIDREELCGDKALCTITFELVLESPLELNRISILIQDLNDNSPTFPKDTIKLEIRESAVKGARYRIAEAHDADIGQYAVQLYNLQTNDNFVLSVHSDPDGFKNVELVLDKELDRETQHDYDLVLVAVDGGTPQRSGTAIIHVTVLDANDNAPVFSQHVYKASLPENAPLKTVVLSEC